MRKSVVLSLDDVSILKKELKKAKKAKNIPLMKRIEGLLLAGENGFRVKDAAKAVGRKSDFIRLSMRRFESEGIVGLYDREGRGGKSRITEQDAKHVVEIIAKGPEKYGFETGAWTGPLVARLIEEVTRVHYNVSHVRRLLHQWGFSVQYPKQKLSLTDHNKQEKWMNEDLPEIKKSLRGKWRDDV